MIELDAASVLLQWAAGGMLFVWVTTRRREVSLGYGWLMRGTYALMAAGAAAVGILVIEPNAVRDASSVLVALVATAGLVSSIVRRKAGVSGHVEESERRSARVAEMTGIERDTIVRDAELPEFHPGWDLAAALVGVPGLIAAGIIAGDPAWLSVARMLVGAAFLGSVTDAMLLGHWYLVQPGLPRAPIHELVRWVGWIWPVEVALLLVPTGMVSALNGDIDDGYNGLLTWFWLACAVTTIGLVVTTRLALRERQYSAVMAATGLLYLAILTAFGTDLVARAVLASNL
jgi:hypothetical protein